jgi:poly-gamma-glutamate synthesis protein (capsule biosynthesis protein)
MLGRGVSEELRRVPSERVWGTTLPILRDADAVLANLECAITPCKTQTTVTRKMFHFRGDPVAIDVLRAGNVRCVSLANNHALDYGEEGLFDTLDALGAAGIAHAGAGRTLGQAAAPAILHLPDLTIGFVGLTDNEPAFAATRHAAGTHYLDIESAPPPGIGLAQLASHCRERNADLAILSLHWGPNMTTAPPARFRELAHAAVDAGFDVIHGHSAHLFHGVEIYRGRPIFYDTGDFIDDYAVDPSLRNDWSFIFLVDVSRTEIERVRLIPVRLNYARVDLATGEEANEIRRRMLDRCADLGTRAAVVGETLEIGCRETVAV